MTRGVDSPTAPRALRREATRQSLLDAAHRLSRRSGAAPADCLDPAQVAAEAGVSRPLFYAHFPDRADFVEALLVSVHDVPPPGPSSQPPAKKPASPVSPPTGRAAVLRFFEGLAEPLDRHGALVRAIVPASHLPGPVADARSRRRERAIAAVAERLPAGTPDRAARAAFLMDAFLGLQLAWSKSAPGATESLAARVRRDLAFALDGVLAPAAADRPLRKGRPASPASRPPSRPPRSPS